MYVYFFMGAQDDTAVSDLGVRHVASVRSVPRVGFHGKISVGIYGK